MLQIFEWFFRWWLAQLKQHQQMDELTTTVEQVDRHYQSKSDALAMRQAAMTTEHEQLLAEMDQVHQQRMTQIRAERKVMLKSLEVNNEEPLKISQK